MLNYETCLTPASSPGFFWSEPIFSCSSSSSTIASPSRGGSGAFLCKFTTTNQFFIGQALPSFSAKCSKILLQDIFDCIGGFSIACTSVTSPCLSTSNILGLSVLRIFCSFTCGSYFVLRAFSRSGVSSPESSAPDLPFTRSNCCACQFKSFILYSSSCGFFTRLIVFSDLLWNVLCTWYGCCESKNIGSGVVCPCLVRSFFGLMRIISTLFERTPSSPSLIPTTFTEQVFFSLSSHILRMSEVGRSQYSAMSQPTCFKEERSFCLLWAT